jgi:UPF0042 nucleotide-binding protein
MLTRFVIVVGMSGAGKSQVMKSLEDLGFSCIDNLPPVLIERMVEMAKESGIEHLVIAPDVRSRGPYGDPVEYIDALRASGQSFEVLFLDATDEVLVRRYSETRRRHPFGGAHHVSDAINVERASLASLRSRADLEWDTSTLNHAALKARAAAAFGAQTESKLSVSVIAFGFKYGLPLDADLVFDVRFLPNPYYVGNLKTLTGADQPVVDYLESLPETQPFLDRLRDMLLFLVPGYLAEGKAHLAIAIGCTGGRHRSVYIARRVMEMLRGLPDISLSFETRDIAR